MANAFVQDSYKLVFPLLCSGYLELDYDESVVVQTTSDLESSGVLVNGTIGTIQAQTGDLQFKALGSASDLTFYAASTMMLSLDGGREVVHHHRGVEYNTVHSNNPLYKFHMLHLYHYMHLQSFLCFSVE